MSKDLKYFQTLKDKYEKRPTVHSMFSSMFKSNDDGLRASYNISLLIAKSGKPHTIGEQLILPAVEEVRFVMGEEIHEELLFGFEDILSMELPPWIINPFDETEVENVILQEELLELSTNELKVCYINLGRCPVSALNGRATAPGKCSESKPSDYSSVCVLCVQECNAEPHSDVPHHHHCAGHRDPPPAGSRRVLCARRISPRVVAFCGLPHRVPRTPPPVSLRNYTRPGPRAARSSRRICGAAGAFDNDRALAATAMEQNQVFLTERGHLDLLREFEAYCASPASPDPQAVVFDLEMDLEYTLPRVSKKRSANARPSEGTSSDSDSDPGSSDSPDHSGFTTVRRRRAAKGSKPKAAGLTQTPDGSTFYRLTPAPRKPKKANVGEATPSGKSTSSIYASPVSWRTPSQPAAAPQGAVGDGGVKAAAPAAAKNNRGDEADVTAPPTPAPRGPKPPPMFVQDKDRWTELRRRCAEKGIQFSQALLTGVPKEIPVDEEGRPRCPKLPVQSVRRILNRFRKPLDLFWSPAQPRPTTTKAAFFKIRSVCSLSGVKAEQPANAPYPGSVTTASPTGTRPVTAIILRAA
ncbi:hypothetical protein EVAR_68798_1 [Eumeta japonica]|uniref:Uncharacterized protein n=1 Tax=Eumeta variegata TaxID=151549 RepID=A0A4C1ZYJ6_EUMVA|nr:hypothetical protein EVAR_68798_1 [Eumeta japonica]